jgi:hypothetical protein
MPPRRCAGSASLAAEHAASSALVVTLRTGPPRTPSGFSLLPRVGCRLRYAEVCRGWRSVLLERSLRTRLDLTAACGVRAPLREHDTLDRAPAAVLRRCSRRRRAAVAASAQSRFARSTATDAAEASAGAVRELHRAHNHPQIHALERATGDAACCGLRRCWRGVRHRPWGRDHTTADVQAARRALRNEARFGPLQRLRHLHAYFRGGEDDRSGCRCV